jgi:Na+-transporting NADH:ubiquinone oxidoreductase subunit NqrD
MKRVEQMMVMATEMATETVMVTAMVMAMATAMVTAMETMNHLLREMEDRQQHWVDGLQAIKPVKKRSDRRPAGGLLN